MCILRSLPGNDITMFAVLYKTPLMLRKLILTEVLPINILFAFV